MKRSNNINNDKECFTSKLGEQITYLALEIREELDFEVVGGLKNLFQGPHFHWPLEFIHLVGVHADTLEVIFQSIRIILHPHGVVVYADTLDIISQYVNIIETEYHIPDVEALVV